MSAKVLNLAIVSQPSMDARRAQSRALASARLRRAICAAGLTQDEAGALVGVDGRQVRRWLASPPDVLRLLDELEARAERKQAA